MSLRRMPARSVNRIDAFSRINKKKEKPGGQPAHSPEGCAHCIEIRFTFDTATIAFSRRSEDRNAMRRMYEIELCRNNNARYRTVCPADEFRNAAIYSQFLVFVNQKECPVTFFPAGWLFEPPIPAKFLPGDPAPLNSPFPAGIAAAETPVASGGFPSPGTAPEEENEALRRQHTHGYPSRLTLPIRSRVQSIIFRSFSSSTSASSGVMRCGSSSRRRRASSSRAGSAGARDSKMEICG